LGGEIGGGGNILGPKSQKRLTVRAPPRITIRVFGGGGRRVYEKKFGKAKKTFGKCVGKKAGTLQKNRKKPKPT